MTGPAAPELTRLRWRARRGMRELDWLLGGYLDARGGGLGDAERRCLGALLEYPDAVLLEWLLGRGRPMDRVLAGLVDRIRDAARP